MAREVLGIAGAAVGGMVGGPIGAQIGFTIGSVIGGIIDPPHIDGPKLGDAAVQTSRDGIPIPIGWGITHVVGNIIQINPIIETTKKVRSGKGGGPTTTETTRTRTFAIGIARSFNGPITGLLRVWENNKLVYDVREGSTFPSADNTAFEGATTLYLGSESQLPDPELEAETGVGNTPAYRALAYCVWNNKELQSFGSSIPSYRFEITASSDLPEQGRLHEWWELDEPSAPHPAPDVHGEVLNTALRTGNQIFSIAGKQDGAIRIDAVGGNEYLEQIADPFVLVTTPKFTPWSCSFFYKTPSSLAGMADTYLANAWTDTGLTGPGHRKWRFVYNAAANGFIFSMGEGPSIGDFTDLSTGNISITGDTWYHMVGVFDPNNEILFYVDAGAPITSAFTDVYTGVGHPAGPVQSKVFYIGRDDAGAGKSNGYVDTFAIWSLALSADQVAAIFNSGDGVTYADLP